ncbi:hypothetical protein J2Z83_002416 [Virgibacillus natechei]|uniref:Uncharacterized protein n=1 Tax=Virgibacillus natechei TaxID=1216297 RepID=A0ABS4IHE8_9BACI|nr:hypothetical protein [Virgibacillus natechei]
MKTTASNKLGELMKSKNRSYEIHPANKGAAKFTGSEETPKDIMES